MTMTTTAEQYKYMTVIFAWWDIFHYVPPISQDLHGFYMDSLFEFIETHSQENII